MEDCHFNGPLLPRQRAPIKATARVSRRRGRARWATRNEAIKHRKGFWQKAGEVVWAAVSLRNRVPLCSRWARATGDGAAVENRSFPLLFVL